MSFSKVYKSANKIANASLRKAILELIDMKVESEMAKAIERFEATMQANMLATDAKIEAIEKANKSLEKTITVNLAIVTIVISVVIAVASMLANRSQSNQPTQNQQSPAVQYQQPQPPVVIYQYQQPQQPATAPAQNAQNGQ